MLPNNLGSIIQTTFLSTQSVRICTLWHLPVILSVTLVVPVVESLYHQISNQLLPTLA